VENPKTILCNAVVLGENDGMKGDQAAAICHDMFREKAAAKAGFARFSSLDACCVEMKGLGHIAADAAKICNGILERALKGALLKATPTGLEVLSKASEEDIVVGGYASWETMDDEGDLFTVGAQSKALHKFFAQPPEYQAITVNHGVGPVKEFKLAQPMLKYVDSEGTEYFSHVNEKGTYLIGKVRDDDLKATRYYREKARKGELNGYSVNAIPLERDGHAVLDMEYTAVTITEKGVMKPVNPKTRDVKVISKAVDVINDAVQEAKKVISKIEANTPPKPVQKADLSTEQILQKYGFNKTVS
jgi:hypothetical protein